MVVLASRDSAEQLSSQRRAIEECTAKAKQASKGTRQSWTSAHFFDSLSLGERAAQALWRHLGLTSDDQMFVFFKELRTHGSDADTVSLLLQQSGVFATLVEAMCESIGRLEGSAAGAERRGSSDSSKFAGRSAQELRDAHLEASELRREGFGAAQLMAGGYTAKELKVAGFEPQELLDAGLDLKQLREARFQAAALRHLGFSPSLIRDAGYTLMEMRAAGFEDEQVRAAGFSLRVLEAEQVMTSEGLAANHLQERGYSVRELHELGFTALAMAKAGIDLQCLGGLPFTAGIDGQCPWGHILKLRVLDRMCDTCYGHLRGHVSFGCPFCNCDFCESCMQRKLREMDWTEEDLRCAGFG